MKILAIGNSFSEDATRYLEPIARSAGAELFVRNLYVGGCSLAMHAENIKTGEAAYLYETDGVGEERVSIADALAREEWDVVTVQQVSAFSGMVDSYDPHLSELLCFIWEKRPGVKIILHRTWSYEWNSTHSRFPLYGSDSDKMFAAITQATKQIADRYSLPILPCGDALQKAKAHPAFDIRVGGLSLHRDGHHLSMDYGRYLAGLVWFKFFTGIDLSAVTFAPEGCKPELLSPLIEIANAV